MSEQAREELLEEVAEAEAVVGAPSLASMLTPAIEEALLARLNDLHSKAVELELPTTRIEALQSKLGESTPAPEPDPSGEDPAEPSIAGPIVLVSTEEEAPNATIANGERIIKVNSEEGDAHPNGSEGTVVGSIDMRGAPTLEALPEDERHVQVAYFVIWDDAPGMPVGTLDFKVVAA